MTMQTLADFKQAFDPIFEQKVATNITQAISYTGNATLATFLQHLGTTMHGGKRFRPYVVEQSYRIAGGTADIAGILCGVELLHVFALIHDDIMDKAPLRHGAPTAQTFIADHYHDTHHGNSQAILLGDLAFAWGAEFFFSTITSPDLYQPAIIAQASEDFATLTKEVIVGQMLDAHLAATNNQPASYDTIITKNRLKTARYSFAWPLVMGNTLAQGGAARREALFAFGTALGLAFQAQDDILDVAASHTGKAKCSDIEQGQQTILSAYIFNQGTEDQKKTLSQLQGILLSDDQKEGLSVFMQESGAIAYAQQHIAEQLAIAKDILTTQLPQEAPLWLSLISEIQQRKK